MPLHRNTYAWTQSNRMAAIWTRWENDSVAPTGIQNFLSSLAEDFIFQEAEADKWVALPDLTGGRRESRWKGGREGTALARLNSCQAGDPTGTFAALHNYELLATLHFLYQRMCGIASTERNNGLWLLQSSGVIGELLFKARKRCKH